MRRNTLLLDAAIAAGVTSLAVILAPGLAVVGLLAILALVVCGVSFIVQEARDRTHPPRVRARSARPPTRPPRPRTRPPRPRA